jgi:serine protease Do
MNETPSNARRLRFAAILVGLGAVVFASAWFDTVATHREELRPDPGVNRDIPRAGFQDIVERVKPAVFGVSAKVLEDDEAGSLEDPGLPLEEHGLGEPEDPLQGPKRSEVTTNLGSGFFISPEGYAVTTNHVIERGQSIEITTDAGKRYPVRLVGSDPETDIALLKVDGVAAEFPYVEIAERTPRTGEWVIAVGNPFGLGGTVTAGILSSGARDIMSDSYNDFLQIDAPVNQGNSGGPTFDVDGKVIGVNSAIFSPTGGSVGIGFAIPAETVKTVVAQLKEKGVVTRGWMGVQIQSVTPEIADGLNFKQARGVLVSEVEAGGPAALAGMQSKDVITSLNGELVQGHRELSKRIADLMPGASVQLGIMRQGVERKVAVKLAARPGSSKKAPAVENQRETPEAAVDSSSLGATLVPGKNLNPDAAGVVVTKSSQAG